LGNVHTAQTCHQFNKHSCQPDDETVQKLETFFGEYDKTMDELEAIIEKRKSVEQSMSASQD